MCVALSETGPLHPRISEQFLATKIVSFLSVRVVCTGIQLAIASYDLKLNEYRSRSDHNLKGYVGIASLEVVYK